MRIPPALIQIILDLKSVAVLTGAGVSQELGLRTFRDAKDPCSPSSEKPLWAQYRPEALATPEAFERNPNMVWEFYAMRRLKSR